MVVSPNVHPYGTTLLSADNEKNRKKWGPNGVGTIGVAATVCTPDGKCPPYHYRDDVTHEGAIQTPIHLLIAAFRDQLCPRTLHNAFTHAENPKRLFIRVIDQTDPASDLIDDAGCWTRYCSDFNKKCQEYQQQVRIVHVDANKAKGPCDARSKLSHMIQWDYLHRDHPSDLDYHPVELNDFCMQTDSHMDFSDNFDTKLIEMHHRTENDNAVLSTYVADMSQNNQDEEVIRNGKNVVPNLCMVEFPNSIRNWGTKQCTNLVRPKLTNAMWGAGLSFHRCHAEINVPYDPYLAGVFNGEEGSRGIRFFTHGYDVYAPDRVLVTHDYHGHQSNPIIHTWETKHTGENLVEDQWKWTEAIERAKSTVKVFGTPRVNLLLGIGIHDESTAKDADEIKLTRSGRYGFGSKRTLEQAVAFTGINLAEQRMEDNKCGNLIWVPFDESEIDYGVNDILSRSLHGEAPPEKVVVLPPAESSTSMRGMPTTAKARGGVEGSSPESFHLESSLDFQTLGGIAVCLMVIARMTRTKFRKKREWHKQ